MINSTARLRQTSVYRPAITGFLCPAFLTPIDEPSCHPALYRNRETAVRTRDVFSFSRSIHAKTSSLP